MPHLFDPFTLKSVTLRNRIVAAPMCTYSAADGTMTAWHHAHLAQLAAGGAGLVTIEATAVSPEGRITWGDLGLWTDAQAAAMAPAVAAIKAAGAVPGLQLAHAGRKASANRPWEGDDHIADDAPLGWPVIAPSALAVGTDSLWKVPHAMSLADIARVQGDFVAAARRALELGVEWLELHFAHGFLAQSFFSPHTNRRDDAYGGSFANRARFLVETVAAVRAVWPERLPLSVRFGVVEYDGHDADTLGEAIALLALLKEAGIDAVSPSLAFTAPQASIPWGPAFMAPVVARIRRETGLPTAIAWGLGAAGIADGAVRDGMADLVKVGHALLANPHWPYAAATALGVPRPAWATLPAPYAHWLERYRPLTTAAA